MKVKDALRMSDVQLSVRKGEKEGGRVEGGKRYREKGDVGG